MEFQDKFELAMSKKNGFPTKFHPGVSSISTGLSDGIVVIETDVEGGTMHTVRHAESQKRGVAAVAHPNETAEHPKARGNRLLIESGRALPIKGRDDLLRFVSSLDNGSHEPSATEKADQLNLQF